MMHPASFVTAVYFALTITGPAFSPYYADRGVKVEMSRAQNQIPWIRGTFELPAPPDRVTAAVADFKRYKELFAPALQSVKVLDSTADSARLHLVWPYPSPLRDRDAVVAYRVQRLPSGGALVSWKGEEKPNDPKVGVRIQHVEGETLIEPVPNGTKVTYTYFGDLGGNFPESIKERAWKGEPIGYMNALRRALGLPVLMKK